jgi:C4-dicarboxylate transporter DctM subunit
LALFGLMAIGVPIAYALAVAGFAVAMTAAAGLPIDVLVVLFAQRLYGGADSFVLLALPLFFLAGALMETGGLSEKLIRLAMTFVGWVRGGLSMVTIITEMIFSGISGAASADVAAVGGVMVPAMKRRGYSPEYAAAVVATAGALGPIIPPSIGLVVYGGLADVSVARLFIGGIGPGIFFGVMLLAICGFIAIRRNYPKEDFPTPQEILLAFIDALIPLAGPVIILGGIFVGLFTATESAMIAVVYALVVSLFIYKTLTWREVLRLTYQSAVDSARVMIIICVASFIGWVLAREQVPQQVVDLTLGISTNPIVVLILINILLLLFGCFLEATAIMVILVPTLLPVIHALGIDPVYFGVIMMINLAIGTVTPPVGTCLFVGAAIANVPMEKIIPEIMPFIAVMVVALLALLFFPEIVMWLPNMM